MNLLSVAALALLSADETGARPGEQLSIDGLPGTILESCETTGSSGEVRATALAIQDASGGRYLVLYPTGRTELLAVWKSSPEISCHTAQSATELHAAILESETVESSLRIGAEGAVICAFVSATEAACWQYSERKSAFERIGGWRT